MNREVSIAIPCAQVVDPKTLQSMMALVNYSANHGIKINHIGITERSLIDDARNVLAETFLKSPTEWLFWMDSDMVFPPDTLVKLFQVAEKKDAKLVTGVYYQRKGENMPCIWSRGQQTETGELTGMGTAKGLANKYAGSFLVIDPNKKEPFEVHAAGFGCVIVHRAVFEIMDRPWFRFLKDICSEDFYFFVNAQDLGFKVWAEPTIDLRHLGDAPLIGKEDFNKKATINNIYLEELKCQETQVK
jgi:hypothetical protein